MELLDRYLQAVKKYLPTRTRAQVTYGAVVDSDNRPLINFHRLSLQNNWNSTSTMCKT